MATPADLAIPKGCTVLVTGANGYLGSHIVNQFLCYGYKVRGTVRDVEKNAWLSALFEKKYGKDMFTLWSVADMTADGALSEVAKGVSAFVHTASILSFDSDPNKVITPSVAFAVNAIKTAYAEPSVKRFVFCSSSSAAVWSYFDRPGIVVTEDSWNEESIADAWADPPYTPKRVGPVYAASKAQSEKAIWEFYSEHRAERPDIVVNTVLPNMTHGSSLDPINQGFPSSAGNAASLYWGEIKDFHRFIPRQWHVDSEDIGRLHVAAAILDKVKGQRIFGFSERYSWDTMLEIFRKLEPNKTFPENFSGGEDPNEIEPRHKAEQLLRDLGQPGWTSLEESMRKLVESIHEAEAAKKS